VVKPLSRTDLLRELRAVTRAPQLIQALLIDDEQRDRYLLKQKLKSAPVAISEASYGVEGIELACKNKPDIIFLDLTMPGLTGFEVLVRLKEEPATANIPVVIVTSQILSSLEREELMRNAVAVIGKEALDRTDIAELLRRTVSRATPAAIETREAG